MIFYEGTAKLPILSSLIPNKNTQLFFFFLGIGIIFFCLWFIIRFKINLIYIRIKLIKIKLGEVEQALSAICFGCCFSFYFLKVWKKILVDE